MSAVTRVLLAVSALALTGCAVQPGGTGSVQSTTASSPSSAATVIAGPRTTQMPATSSLTQDEIDRALLNQADMPDGWMQDTSAGDPDVVAGLAASGSGDVYAPGACAEIMSTLGGTARGEHTPAAHGSAYFAAEGVTYLFERIETWDGAADTAGQDVMVTALSSCPEYTVTSADGTTTTNTVTPLDMTKFGDRTVAIRMTSTDVGEGDPVTITLDMVTVVTGTTSVQLVLVGLTQRDTVELAGLVGAAIDKVNAVA